MKSIYETFYFNCRNSICKYQLRPISKRFYTYTTGVDEFYLVEDQALELYIDYSKDISTPETEEEDINTLFQLSCGTTEKFLNDEE